MSPRVVSGDWPTLLPAPGAAVEGYVLVDLSEADGRRLDAYAGVAENLYERLLVAIELDGREETGWTYRATEHAARRYGAPR